jgi:hypothetical protein
LRDAARGAAVLTCFASSVEEGIATGLTPRSSHNPAFWNARRAHIPGPRPLLVRGKVREGWNPTRHMNQRKASPRQLQTHPTGSRETHDDAFSQETADLCGDGP